MVFRQFDTDAVGLQRLLEGFGTASKSFNDILLETQQKVSGVEGGFNKAKTAVISFLKSAVTKPVLSDSDVRNKIKFCILGIKKPKNQRKNT